MCGLLVWSASNSSIGVFFIEEVCSWPEAAWEEFLQDQKRFAPEQRDSE